jgi:purine-binding chemotaxis protein CheW
MADDRTANEEQLVVFDLAGESYGLSIAAVQEIVRMQHITKVPRAPEFVEGVTNLRGRIIPVLNLRYRLGLASEDNSGSARIVVVQISTHTVGLIVDAVSEVLMISSDAIEPPSPVVKSVDSMFLRGVARVGERLILLFSLDSLLSIAETKSIASMTQEEAA